MTFTWYVHGSQCASALHSCLSIYIYLYECVIQDYSLVTVCKYKHHMADQLMTA